jgi:hypothetical protein
LLIEKEHDTSPTILPSVEDPLVLYGIPTITIEGAPSAFVDVAIVVISVALRRGGEQSTVLERRRQRRGGRRRRRLR